MTGLDAAMTVLAVLGVLLGGYALFAGIDRVWPGTSERLAAWVFDR